MGKGLKRKSNILVSYLELECSVLDTSLIVYKGCIKYIRHEPDNL